MLHYHTSGGRKKGLRWDNRKAFVDREVSSADSSCRISILMICYNNTDQFFSLLERFDKEPSRSRFTITIIQNSDKPEAITIFDEKIVNHTNITVLYPIDNLGSAGGYALGQEYIIHKGYSHLIMIEDDITLLEDDTISTMIAAIDESEKNVVFIEHPINAGGTQSRYVQIGCYPTSLLTHSGIIDPRYFFRSEDLDWGVRLEDAISTHGYYKAIVSRHYYHPYLKAMNNSGSWMYFSVRNQLWTFKKHHTGWIRLMMSMFLYLSFGIFVWLKAKKKGIMLCIVQALYDGRRGYRSFGYNRKIIERFSHDKKLALHDLGFTVEEMHEMPTYVDSESMIARTTLSLEDRLLLSRYRGNLAISGGFQPVWGWYMIGLQRLFIIEDLRLDDNKKCSGKLLRQTFGSCATNLLLFLPAVLLSGVAIIVYTLLFLPTSSLKK